MTEFFVPGAVLTPPGSINESGQIVGVYYDQDGNFHGFFFDGAAFTTLVVPGGINPQPTGVSSRGSIIGYYADGVDPDNVRHGLFAKEDCSHARNRSECERIQSTLGN